MRIRLERREWPWLAVVGEITAEKYPQFLSGPGRLYVKPRNLVIIIR